MDLFAIPAESPQSLEIAFLVSEYLRNRISNLV